MSRSLLDTDILSEIIKGENFAVAHQNSSWRCSQFVPKPIHTRLQLCNPTYSLIPSERRRYEQAHDE